MHLQHARAGHSLIYLHRSCHGGHRELHESHCTTNATKESRAGFSSEVQCQLFRPHAVQVLHNNAPIRSGPVLAVQKHFQPGAPFLTGVHAPVWHSLPPTSCSGVRRYWCTQWSDGLAQRGLHRQLEEHEQKYPLEHESSSIWHTH